ncbi:hypothetical protein EC1_00830 [Faecalitalea cylindroides T2-87]|uniref:Uncharacterized protein n=1 Tax=Faecalitalea cylindroides T2-87 TaxID=717960 RepID=D4JCF9_9FIRM|nr:hypothetical protein EC1_00830 [Faecalitalea cylindroides T2-87]
MKKRTFSFLLLHLYCQMKLYLFLIVEQMEVLQVGKKICR